MVELTPVVGGPAVIYEMLTGLPAERFPHLGRRARQIVKHPQLNRLVRLALRACQPEPHERYANAADMITALTSDWNVTADGNNPSRHVVAAATACLAGLIVAGTLWWKPWQSTSPPPQSSRQSASPAEERVGVIFFTESPNFDAAIDVDGKRLDEPDGPCKTSSTVEGLSAKPHQVAFKLPGMPDLDLGTIDFAQTQQIVGRWPQPDTSQ